MGCSLGYPRLARRLPFKLNSSPKSKRLAAALAVGSFAISGIPRYRERGIHLVYTRCIPSIYQVYINTIVYASIHFNVANPNYT
jgi:hypothetical protein